MNEEIVQSRALMHLITVIHFQSPGWITVARLTDSVIIYFEEDSVTRFIANPVLLIL